jgi:hypothetical protein
VGRAGRDARAQRAGKIFINLPVRRPCSNAASPEFFPKFAVLWRNLLGEICRGSKRNPGTGQTQTGGSRLQQIHTRILNTLESKKTSTYYRYTFTERARCHGVCVVSRSPRAGNGGAFDGLFGHTHLRQCMHKAFGRHLQVVHDTW